MRIALENKTCYAQVMRAVLILLLIFAFSWQPGFAQDVKPTATSPNPGPIETVEPRLTPTPWVVIMVTATPDLRPTPPSLQVADLSERIRSKSAPAGLAMLARLDIPDDLDQALDIFFAWLVGRQLEYRQMTGRFAQMLPSHISSIPTDGNHLYPDGWYTHPTDQQYSWDTLRAIQYEPLPVSIKVDVYDGPEGKGFVACYQMIYAGQITQRCDNYGPEALRATNGWQVIE